MMNAFQNAMTNVFGQRQQESANPAAGGVSDWMAFNTGPSPIFPGNPGAYPNAQDMFTGNSPFATRTQGYYDANGLWIPGEQAHGYIASGAQQFDIATTRGNSPFDGVFGQSRAHTPPIVLSLIHI